MELENLETRLFKFTAQDLCILTVLYTDSGLADFVPITNEVLTFQPGKTEQFVNFTSLPDDIVEGTEMLTAVLSNPSVQATIGEQGTATIDITENAGNY